MKNALVAGAGGFIGSHLVKRLKAEGYDVRGVDLKRPQFDQTGADDYERVKAGYERLGVTVDVRPFLFGTMPWDAGASMGFTRQWAEAQELFTVTKDGYTGPAYYDSPKSDTVATLNEGNLIREIANVAKCNDATIVDGQDFLKRVRGIWGSFHRTCMPLGIRWSSCA